MRQLGFINQSMLHKRFETILTQAIDAYTPKKILVSYGGGHDSATVLHMMTTLDIIEFEVFTIDTGLSTSGHISRIYDEVVNKLGLKLWIYGNDGAKWYRDQVRENGFAYTPTVHTIYYRMLKERSMMTALRDFKANRFDNIMFLTGVRRLESIKRRNTPLTSKTGSRVFCNPIAEYTDSNKELVMDNCLWWTGKTTEDCMCNWHCKYDLNTLASSPELHKYMSMLNEEMKDNGMWGYGEKPDLSLIQGQDVVGNDDMPDDSLCVNCYSKVLL